MAGREQIVATFEIVTPMFLGGANPNDAGASCDLRVRETSVRGALAFWWRALNYPLLLEKYRSNSSANPSGDALAELKISERRLFGADNGQGRFIFRVMNSNLQTLQKGHFLLRTGNAATQSNIPSIAGDGVRYFGYGLIQPFGANAGQLQRSAIAPGSTFDVRILVRPKPQPDDVRQLCDALVCLGTFGGLGARVRRGFGSLCLSKITGNIPEGFNYTAPTSAESYANNAREFIARHASMPGADFPITAFGNDLRCLLGKPKPQALEALDEPACGMLRYRAWGHDSRVGNVRVERAFARDHDWSKGLVTPPTSYVPQRIAFGLPQNYKDFYSATAPTANGEDLDRRASPLSFHVHKVGQSFHTVALFLPTRFLPVNRVTVRRNSGSRRLTPMANYDFKITGRPIIDDYLDGKSHSAGTTPSSPYFPMQKIIYP